MCTRVRLSCGVALCCGDPEVRLRPSPPGSPRCRDSEVDAGDVAVVSPAMLHYLTKTWSFSVAWATKVRLPTPSCPQSYTSHGSLPPGAGGIRFRHPLTFCPRRCCCVCRCRCRCR